MAPIKFGVGQSVLRKEDDALIRGKGRYTDDHAPSPAMHALVLRSPHAHAKFTINAARARGLPGVATILTAEDVKDLGGLPCLFNLEVDPFTGPPYAILAHGVVRHVGDAVAFVVAETIDQARDAIEAIEVEWTPLPAVIGVANAVKQGAPQVWPDHPGNVLFDVPIGDKKATETAFAKAHTVAEISIVNPAKSDPLAYPICTFTYVILPTKTDKAAQLRRFVFYALSPTQGQKFGPKLLFAPIPTIVLVASEKTLKKVQS